ncbi:MAG: RecQ family ATP-dependent DNA helicase [Acidobacteriaceae bacterium]
MTTAPPQSGETLENLLHRTFGFRSFRANQEEVCRAALSGKDVLLVMPTGAGKSLCYQLPGLARGGTTLVISPLIALMDDQASKLAALGCSVARIHSGLDRATSRQACVEYLNGTLQFLFIAPERLRVPGFAEMLAKRKPSLIAIDEAHCISQWGHDFRPDYRMLGQSLPMLRPAPVIALTATATPVVQDDIVKQLGQQNTLRFIHGFRRTNLAIEVVEVPQANRAKFASELLADASRRPAIIYAPTRKHAETLAATLQSQFPAAAYHAGLDPQLRERVQRQFLDGKLQAVVATIAFGMGIDKADVRTVIHTALPASLEAYYQEIGRAGRDGAPSRTILMHAYSDRRTHDFFFERDYPPVEDLDKIYRKLNKEPQQMEDLRSTLKMDAELFDKALEKLFIHGGAAVDYNDDVTLGIRDWREPYKAQSEQRQSQIARVLRYVEGRQCRMSALVSHFGDVADGRRPCNHCDVCDPKASVAQSFREATESEVKLAHSIARALRKMQPTSTGNLYKELFPREDFPRSDFEDLLRAMAAADLVQIEDTSFEKDGRSIPFRKASLTRDGDDFDEETPVELMLRRSTEQPTNSAKSAAKAKPRSEAKKKVEEEITLTAAETALEAKLRDWRTEKAKTLNLPPFMVLGNKTLRAIVLERPSTSDELRAVVGMGPAKTEKFGKELCAFCAER